MFKELFKQLLLVFGSADMTDIPASSDISEIRKDIRDTRIVFHKVKEVRNRNFVCFHVGGTYLRKGSRGNQGSSNSD